MEVNSQPPGKNTSNHWIRDWVKYNNGLIVNENQQIISWWSCFGLNGSSHPEGGGSTLLQNVETRVLHGAEWQKTGVNWPTTAVVTNTIVLINMCGGETSGGRGRTELCHVTRRGWDSRFCGGFAFHDCAAAGVLQQKRRVCYVLLCSVVMIDNIPIAIDESFLHGLSGIKKKLCLQMSSDICILVTFLLVSHLRNT
jgi:hypothetical protein